jgi:hypothetical protein
METKEMYYVVSYDSKMVAMVTITITINFDLETKEMYYVVSYDWLQWLQLLLL